MRKGRGRPKAAPKEEAVKDETATSDNDEPSPSVNKEEEEDAPVGSPSNNLEPEVDEDDGKQESAESSAFDDLKEESIEESEDNKDEVKAKPAKKTPRKRGKASKSSTAKEDGTDEDESEPDTKKRRGRGKATKTVDVKEDESSDKDGGSDVEYEVSAILDSRGEKGDMEFLVRWKGFKADDDTWEPEENLSCKDKIKAFLSKEPAKKATPKKGKKGRSATQKAKENGKAAKRGRGRKAAPKNDDDDGTDEDDETEYEVKSIIEVHNLKNGKREFLVRWKGFSSKDDTWEPEDNLNCHDLIAEFEKKVTKAKSASQRETRVQRKPTDRLVYDTKKKSKGSRTRGIRKTYYDED